jgi:hypothetical protein
MEFTSVDDKHSKFLAHFQGRNLRGKKGKRPYDLNVDFFRLSLPGITSLAIYHSKNLHTFTLVFLSAFLKLSTQFIWLVHICARSLLPSFGLRR